MNEGINLLNKIEEIIEVKEIFLTQEFKEKIGMALVPKAEDNSQYINVYRIIYLSQGHKVVGYIVEPRKGENLPCIVYNRSGTGDVGTIKIGQLFLGFSSFALQGYITIFTQYSGNAGSEGIDEVGGSDIEDVLNLYTILKKYPRADDSRIGMYGVSRGGMMTYLALKNVDWIKAAVIVAGPADLVGKKDFRPEMDDRYTAMFGDSREERIKRSALYWANELPQDVPILIMHGTADWRVNPLDSMLMAEKLYENKITYRLVMFEGADHGLTEFQEEAMIMTQKWYDRFVKNRESLPDLTPHGK